MIKHYFTTAIRNLMRNKGFATINVFGLATGLAVCILISMYVGYEYSYDRFHAKKDRIYRLGVSTTRPDGTERTPISAPAMGADIKRRLPEVEAITRFMEIYTDMRYNDKTITSGMLLTADSALFDIFSFKLTSGNSKTALKEPFSIVLSQSLAHKLFGGESPIGKAIQCSSNSYSLHVTGVVEDAPGNSTISYQAFVSFQTLYHLKTGTLTEWDGNFSFTTYLLVKENCDVALLTQKINAMADEIINPKLSRFNVKLELFLQPLGDIHLYSNLQYEQPGVAKKLYLFIAISLFILFIAGFNFINLSTALGSKRTKEIGMRMVVGSSKTKIRLQQIGETMIVCTISCLLALLLVEMAMPLYNNITGLQLSLYQPRFGWIRYAIPPFIITFSVLAGFYPAYYLTSYNPIAALKSDTGVRNGKSVVRNTLVTIQFAISTVLIICTMIIFMQIGHMQKKEMGIDIKNLLVLTVNGTNPWHRADILIDEFAKLPEVESTSFATEVSGNTFTQNGYRVEGVADPVMIRALGVSHGYIKNMGIKLVEGRGFATEFPSDSEAVVVNETFVKQVGWTSAIGKTITREKKFRVIGVIKDFHFRSLHKEVEPLIMFLPFDDIRYYWNPVIHIRLREGDIQNSLKKVEDVWKRFGNDSPIDYTFISNIYKSHYQSEVSFGKLFIYFTMLSIIISCLGLIGMASFNLKARTREVSVRKVMGSSTPNIIKLISIDFTKWTLLANVFAWPIAWYSMSSWLNDYPYRIGMPWWIFICTAMGLFTLSILTIFYQTYKIARINPAQTLKYE
jgi:putative ABC transport system permease protein